MNLNCDEVKLYVDETGGSSGTKNYEELTNKPSINGVELVGNVTSSQLGLNCLFPCTYNVTTYAEITNALANGQLPFCIRDNRCFVYQCLADSGYHFWSRDPYAHTSYYLRVAINSSGTYWSFGIDT